MKRVYCTLASVALLILLVQVGVAGVSPGGLGTHPEDMDAQHQSDGIQADALAYQQVEDFIEQIASEILPSGGPRAVAMATECVEVDIELPALVEFEPGGGIPFATGYFELVNCGDEAAEVILDLEASIYIEGVIDTTFAIGGIPVMMAAGQVISREFVFPVPPFDASYTICITATSGDAVANDCATMVVEGLGFTSNAPGGRMSDRPSDMYADTRDGAAADYVVTILSDFVYELFGQILGQPLDASMATECVEIDLELPDTIFVEGGFPFGSGYFELINCGDEAAEIMLQLEASIFIEDIIDTTFIFPAIPLMMGAGEVISHEFMFIAPPFDASYTFCVTAVNGEAQDADCATLVVVGGEWPEWPGPPAGAPRKGITAQNYPNPFNPITTISLNLPSDSHVKLEIYNILGRVVSTLADDYLSAGEHEFQWNGTDGSGNRAASGIYFYRIQSGSYSLVKKMLLVK